MFHAHGKSGVDGGYVVRFTTCSWGSGVVVEMDRGGGDEEEGCTTRVGFEERRWGCEVCVADCEVLGLEMGEFEGGCEGGGLLGVVSWDVEDGGELKRERGKEKELGLTKNHAMSLFSLILE